MPKHLPGEIKHSPDTVIRAIREAFPAQASVLASLLAERGVRGFAHPFEGRAGFFALYADGSYAPGDLLNRLGERYWIDELSFKKWPCCRGTHAYIEAAQRLRDLHRFDADEVVELKVAGGELQRMLCEPMLQKHAPQTVIEAKFSLPFTLAVALRDAEVTLGSFKQETLRDPALLSVAGKFTFDFDPKFSQQATAGELTVVLRDGSVLTQRIAGALGDAARPLDDAALRAKFVDCAMRAAVPFSQEAAQRLADRILDLERELDAGSLLGCAGPLI